MLTPNTQHPTPNTQHPTRKGLWRGAGLIALVLPFSFVALVGCRKDAAAPDLCPSEDRYDPSQRILTFKYNALHAIRSKSETWLSKDSAVWYIEAALNHGDTDPSKKFRDYYIDSVAYSIVLSNNSIHSANALLGYAELRSVLHSRPLPTGFTVTAIDVSETVSGDSLLLTAYRLSGGGGELDIEKSYTINSNYGINDKYVFGTGSGYCYCGNAQVPPIPNRCADKIIQDRLNSAIAFAVGPNQYLTDVQIWHIQGDPDASSNISMKLLTADMFPTPGWSSTLCGLLQFLTFQTDGCIGIPEDTGHCLNHGSMIHHTQGALTAMLAIKQTYIANPAIKPIISLIQGDKKVNPLDLGYIRWHDLRFTYGRYYTAHPAQ